MPLWLAARLRQRSQCVIVPPRWLSLDHLEKVNHAHGRKAAEKETELLQLPYRWREIAHRILAVYVIPSRSLLPLSRAAAGLDPIDMIKTSEC